MRTINKAQLILFAAIFAVSLSPDHREPFPMSTPIADLERLEGLGARLVYVLD